MKIITYRCDGENCKNVTMNPQDWFLIWYTDVYFTVRRWTKSGRGTKHLCESCLNKLVTVLANEFLCKEESQPTRRIKNDFRF